MWLMDQKHSRVYTVLSSSRCQSIVVEVALHRLAALRLKR